MASGGGGRTWEVREKRRGSLWADGRQRVSPQRWQIRSSHGDRERGSFLEVLRGISRGAGAGVSDAKERPSARKIETRTWMLLEQAAPAE